MGNTFPSRRPCANADGLEEHGEAQPEILERRPETKPRQRLMIGLGTRLPSGVKIISRILITLEEEEVMEVLGLNLANFPAAPVKVKLDFKILEG